MVWRKRNLKVVVKALTITVSLGLKGEEELKKKEINKEMGEGMEERWIGEENGHKGSIRRRCILESTEANREIKVK